MLPQIKTNPNTKTIQIEARPMWETMHHIQPYLSENSIDRQRVLKYKNAKEVLDAYARKVIEVATQRVADTPMAPTYAELEELFNNTYDRWRKNAYQTKAATYKKVVAGIIKEVAGDYQLLKNSAELFKEDKSAIYRNAEIFGIDKETLDVLSLYKGFTSYFKKYFDSLSNTILCGVDYGSIAHRIMENMEYYWRNMQVLEEIKENHPKLYVSILDDIEELDLKMCMTQAGIDTYNMILGNTSNNGINSVISMYAQKNHVRVKLLKKLNKIPLAITQKQIVVEFIENDEELSHIVMNSIPVVEDIILFAKRCLTFQFDDETKESTYFINKNLTSLSNSMFGRYDLLSRAVAQLELSEREKKDQNISLVNVEKAVKLIEEEPKKGYADVIREHMEEVLKAAPMLNRIQNICEKGSCREERKYIKEFYDHVLHARYAVSLFYTNEVENTFIEDAAGMRDIFKAFNDTYNMVRNYCTKNPIQKNQVDMFFNKGTFLASLDSDKFKNGESLSTLLRKDGMFYLYVLNPAVSTKMSETAYVEEGGYDRLVYKQLTGLNKMFPKCFVSAKNAGEKYGLTDEIADIVKNKKYTKEAADRESCVKWIQYCIDSFKKNEEWNGYYNIPFKAAEEYESANDFYTQAEKHTTYIAWSEHLDEAFIRQSVMKGDAFLFQLYNKDFSPYKTGKDGNYTRILKEMFSEENLRKINETDKTAVKLLSGGAALKYRSATLPFKETHPANLPMQNKNPLNPKHTSTMNYSLSKDKRFMKDKFTLYLALQIGYRNDEVNVYEVNKQVNEHILQQKPNILTIRAGEEHLLYYIVTDFDGKILEQKALNVIESHGTHHTVQKDFKDILSKREVQMNLAKEEWDYSVDIKDVKAGYVGFAINTVLNARDKYDAVIFLEDYSGDFVSKRRANAKAVYQMFQTALLRKLSCYTPERTFYSEAVQLAAETSSLADMKGQKEIVYFVNASYTANVDFTSGFCNQYYDAFTYENMKKADKVCEKLKVVFDDKQKEFLVTLKEDDFGLGTGKEWTLHTSGERSQWSNKKLESFNCTQKLADLMKEYRLSEFKDYKEAADKAFYEKFFLIMRVLLRMHYSNTDGGDGYFLSPITGYDTRNGRTNEPANSTAVKTYLVMLKGLRDLKSIDEETFLVTRDEKGKHKENWLAELQSQLETQ